jgi:hypothetical protein
LWRPGHLMQHSITLLLAHIAFTQPGGVLGHCPVENTLTHNVPNHCPGTLGYIHYFLTRGKSASYELSNTTG